MITYPSDLTDAQWEEIEPWVPDLQNRYNLPYRERDVVDAIRYQYHQNCEWNELPDAFPPAEDVQRHLHEWTAGSDRHEPSSSFLSRVRVGLPERDRGLTDADPGLDEEEAAIQQAIAASFEQAIPERSAQESESCALQSTITSDTIARRSAHRDRKTRERTSQLEGERGYDSEGNSR
jgi:hypothetical protein